MSKVLIGLGLLASIFTLNLQAMEKAKPASTLIQAFKSQCPSVVTRHVQGSIANIEGLMYTIQALKADSNCSGASELESVLVNYNRIYGEYQVYLQTRDSQVEAENRISRFTQILDQGGNTPEIEYFIRNEIFMAQADLISINTDLDRFDNFGNNRAMAAAQLLTGLEGFLGTWQDNPACFEKKSSLVGSLLSNGLLSAAAFTNPGTSLALAAGGVMIQSLNKFIHDFKYNDAIGDLDEIEMPTAIRCISQAFTDQYCDAQDSLNLIDVYRNNYGRDDSRLKGVELLSKHMDHLGHWLQEVYAGSAITSEGDLVNREKPILQAELLEKVIRYIQTYGTIRSRLFSDISTPRERSEAVAIGISNLVSIMSSPTLTPSSSMGPFGRSSSDDSTENPIFISRDKTLLPYQLYDPNMTDVPLCSQGGGVERKCTSLQEYTRVKGITLTLSDWADALQNALKVVQEVLEQVNIERARTVSVDSFSVLVRANSDLRGETNAISALVKISQNADRIADYLTELGCKDDNGNLVLENCYRGDNGELYPEITHPYSPQITNTRKTKELNEVVLKMVKEGFRPRSMPDDTLPEECVTAADDRFSTFNADPIELKSFKITSCITKVLKLAERGNDVFFRKIRDMVGYELEARFLSGEFEDEVGDMVYATRVDLVNALLETYGQGNGRVSLGEIYTGLETSMNLTRESLKEFMNFFKKGVDKSFERTLARGEKADLCFRILPALDEEDQDLMENVWNQCSNVEMNFYAEGPKLVWSDFVGRKTRTTIFRNKKHKYYIKTEKSELDRYCAIKDYNRKNLLIEEYRRRQKEFEEKRSMFE
ncbi:MAG: hypothetical protein EP319_05455 [Deltaproteobacteria bacterium]|nr:MAG: hypothetical protein EP319_05455 [Deltaproteobacteria bacterium]